MSVFSIYSIYSIVRICIPSQNLIFFEIPLILKKKKFENVSHLSRFSIETQKSFIRSKLLEFLKKFKKIYRSYYSRILSWTGGGRRRRERTVAPQHCTAHKQLICFHQCCGSGQQIPDPTPNKQPWMIKKIVYLEKYHEIVFTNVCCESKSSSRQKEPTLGIF